MTHALRLGIVVMSAAIATIAVAQQREHATVGGVRIEARPVNSSTGLPRTPFIAVHNRSTTPQTIEIVKLESIGPDSAVRDHRLVRSLRRTLAPGARARLELEYVGDPLHANGGGLGWHKFRVRVRVGTAEAAIITTTAYICRIPRRPD